MWHHNECVQQRVKVINNTNSFSCFCATSGDLGRGNLDITNHLCLFFCYWYLSHASALFPAILHQNLLCMLPTLKVSQRSLKLIFHLISLDRCKIWGSVGTKVCEKVLGGDESACLWALASKGVTAMKYRAKKDRRVTRCSYVLGHTCSVLPRW